MKTGKGERNSSPATIIQNSDIIAATVSALVTVAFLLGRLHTLRGLPKPSLHWKITSHHGGLDQVLAC